MLGIYIMKNIRHKKPLNLGVKINSLTYIKELDPIIRKDGGIRNIGLFKCDCGNEEIKHLSEVKTGTIKLCRDCSFKNKSIKRRTHYLCSHILYSKLNSIKTRCYNKKRPEYKNYGGRGIRLCDEWNSNFKSFYDWAMNNGYKDGLTVERIDVDKDYSPENCKFITLKEQAKNKRNTLFVIYKGKKVRMIELLTQKGLMYKYGIISRGLRNGKDFSKYVELYNI